MTRAANDEASSALEPRLSLTIGVTGHRLARLEAAQLPEITAAIDTVLDAIGAATRFAEPSALRLVNALADGADSLVADAALARGWTLDAVLPFAADDYAADFTGAAQTAYRAHLAAARARFELPGARTSEGERAAAYERAGRVVIAQCDLLIAVWDGGPVRGRGGAAQIVAEAVMQGVPVLRIDPRGVDPAQLLWDGLDEHSLGQQTIDTVPRGDLHALPALIGNLIAPPDTPEARTMLNRFRHGATGQSQLLWIAYPLLLTVMGVRRLRLRDVRSAAPLRDDTGGGGRGLGVQLQTVLAPRFARADAIAGAVGQRFRSSYVTNFAFAALAVVLSLLGLVLPSGAKPFLIASEVAIIAAILIITRLGNRAGWHRRWLDNRHLAERLRCLSISARLGDLDLRADADVRPGWVGWIVRATARELGLPDAQVDAPYLAGVRRALCALIDSQIAYLSADARRMHKLEHRLHLLGTALFATTAIVCLLVLFLKVADTMAPTSALAHVAHPLITLATIASAGLPAIGAAIYGIRMQGDFAGAAERSEALAHQLASLRTVIDADAPGFDTLTRRARRLSDLLTQDLTRWLQTYHARPLALPG